LPTKKIWKLKDIAVIFLRTITAMPVSKLVKTGQNWSKLVKSGLRHYGDSGMGPSRRLCISRLCIRN